MQPSPGSYEQRRFPRVPLHYAVKLTADSLAPRFLTGRTCNLSAGGAYLELSDFPGTAPLPVGTRVALALPTQPGDAIIPSSEMHTATIVRTATPVRGMGIRFDHPITIAIPQPDRRVA